MTHPLTKPDCTGKTFGQLTVIGRGESIKKKSAIRGWVSRGTWLLECTCGNTISLPRSDFESGRQKSCGCARKRGLIDNKKQARDISNQRFGNLIAVQLTTERNERNNLLWLCKCDCGGEIKLSCKQLNSPQSAKNCRGSCPYYKLWYPPTPNPYPAEAGILLEKYLHLTHIDEKYKFNKQAVEDNRIERLIRHCWILTYRRSQGEFLSELYEQRYIKKSLAFAPQDVFRKHLLEYNGGFYYNPDNKLIGNTMTDVTLNNYPVIETQGINLMPENKKSVKRLKFKRF